MGWLSNWIAEIEERPAAPPPIARPLPRQPKAEIKTVWVQTAAPRDGDAGGAEAGRYSVCDGVVTMYDENGKPTGKSQRLAPDEDAHKIAGRLTLAAWRKVRGESNFNRRITCPPLTF